jgi:signal recognition particle subunit SRP54
MQAVRRMGPIANILGMLPGAGQIKDQLDQFDEKSLDRVQAIIRGMTPAERADPKIINGSRRLRIARGSGVEVREINELVNRFFDARKMMQQMAGRFGLPGSRPKATKKGKKGKKGTGRGPTPPKVRGGFPAGMPDLSKMPQGLNELPPGLAGLDQLPAGFDPSKLKFDKKKK